MSGWAGWWIGCGLFSAGWWVFDGLKAVAKAIESRATTDRGTD
jgi:hypothetical protein